jgi:DNA recombination-dependent growth factor C
MEKCMGILSSTGSVTRYRVEGKFEESPVRQIQEILEKFTILDIDKEPDDIAVGWTSLENPYTPDFSKDPIQIGTYFTFCLRIDKKSIPSKVIKQHVAMENEKKLRESNKEFLSKNEKKEIKEHVENVMNLRIPPTPNIYDIIWDYENSLLYFFSTQKKANEELETLFFKSFRLKLIRLFPFTISTILSNLTDTDKDKITNLSPANFSE